MQNGTWWSCSINGMYLLKAYYEPGYVSSFPPVENSQTLSLPSAEQLLVRNPELSTYYTIVQ